MPRSAFIYCGTESASVLTGVLADDGTIRHTGSLSVAPESDALVSSAAGFSAKLSGAPRVEWVTAHPSGTWLYSFVSFWDKRPGILRTHAIADLQPTGQPQELRVDDATFSVLDVEPTMP